MKKIIRLFIIGLLLFIPAFKGVKALDIYLFYSDTCPHCKAEEKFLDSYLKSNEDVVLHAYEVTKNSDNAELFMVVPRGPFGIPLPMMPGPKTLCELRAGT